MGQSHGRPTSAPTPFGRHEGSKFLTTSSSSSSMAHNKHVQNMSRTSEHVDAGDYDTVLDVYDTIVDKVGEWARNIDIGIICGSGLGNLADLLEDPVALSYKDIPGFPQPHVEGHKGNLVFGHLHGWRVVCQQGRFHPYEHNMDLTLCTLPVRLMHLMGVNTLIVSNAAGGINPRFRYGDLMIIKDHIFLPGLAGFSPLVGINDPRFGQRFVSVHDCYDITLRQQAKELAARLLPSVHEGTYVMSGGPQYESPAEVKLFQTVGADALGMSTCHEVTVARQCGIRVFGFSLITNIANLDADTSVVVSHLEVLETAKEAGARATTFVSEMLLSLKSMPTHKANAPCFDRKRPRIAQ